MTKIIQDSFKINIDVLRFFGLYPPINNSVLAKVKSLLFYFLSYVLVSILIFIRILSNNDYDNIQMNLTIIFLWETVGFAFKVLPLLLDGRRIMKCVNYFEQPQFEPTDLEEKRIIDECVYECRRNSTAFFYGIMASVVVWSFPAFRHFNTRRLPINCWLPYDPGTNLFSYCP